MLAYGQYDFDANTFLNKGLKSCNFSIQIIRFQHKINKKFIMITVR
jgi:hypothetical protein